MLIVNILIYIYQNTFHVNNKPIFNMITTPKVHVWLFQHLRGELKYNIINCFVTTHTVEYTHGEKYRTRIVTRVLYTAIVINIDNRVIDP